MMQFSIKEWRRMYDTVQSLGAMLRDSRPTYEENGDYIAPKVPLNKDAQNILEDKIRLLTIKSTRYLDVTGMKPRKPLWAYERNSPSTHMSHPDFKYGHLLQVQP